MAKIDQSGIRGKIRDRPIAAELERLLIRAAEAAGVDTVYVTSGGQPGTTGKTTGSTRHNAGRAADLHLVVDGRRLRFTDAKADPVVERFVTAAAAYGALGMGAGLHYMGDDTLHIGFGKTPTDSVKVVWGAKGAPANAPKWLRQAANLGWNNPPDWVFSTATDAPEDLSEDEDDVLDEIIDAFFGDHRKARDPDVDADINVEIDIPARFNLEVIQAAQATQRRWGVPASITLAQWALESGYGKRMPANSNNPFGIKARPGQPQVSASTIEVIGGSRKRLSQPFRAYGSIEEAFQDHGRLLGEGQPYVRARRVLNDPDRFAAALTGVYATDPSYGAKLQKIMRDNDLYRFDGASFGRGQSSDVGEVDMGETLRTGVMDSIEVRALQEKLVDLGYSLGKVDGDFGSLTAGALLAFQYDNHLPFTGELDQATRAAFKVARPRPLDRERLKTSEEDLAKDGSRVVTDARRARILSWVTGLLGDLGVGNSAAVNAEQGRAATSGANLPDNLLQFLDNIQKLAGPVNAPQLKALSDTAKSLADQVKNLSLPQDAASQLRRAIPPDLLSNPGIASALESIEKLSTSQARSMNTIFDVLPTLFANDSALQTLMTGVATVAGSVLPGFGGSAAILAAGLAGRHFANRIAAARVEDHRSGVNLRSFRP